MDVRENGDVIGKLGVIRPTLLHGALFVYGMSVARLVAQKYVPGYFPGACVWHRDCNLGNNWHENLEWISRSEMNMRNKKKKVEYFPEPVRGDLARKKKVLWGGVEYGSVKDVCGALGISRRHFNRVVGGEFRGKELKIK